MKKLLTLILLFAPFIAFGQKSYNVPVDYERGLVVLKATMQDRDEEERQCSFEGNAKIVAAQDHPRGLRYAAKFDGDGDYLNYGNAQSANFGSASFSVECWLTIKSGMVNFASALGKLSNASTNGWHFRTLGSGTIYWHAEVAVPWGSWAISDGVDYQDTGWHHVVGVCDRENNRAAISIDGIEVASDEDISNVGSLSNSFNFYVGALGISLYWHGQISGVRLWNYVLSATEVTQLYNGTVGSHQDDLVALWDLPNLTNLVADTVVVNQGADIVASGRNSGNAFDLVSGNTDTVNCGNVGSIKSVAFWINPDNVTQSLIDFDGGTHKLTVAGGTISATGWASPTIYVNGKISSTFQSATWQRVTVTTDTAFSASAMLVGCEGANYLDGMVDLVEVYSSSLTQLQEQFRYHKTQRGFK